MSSQQPRGCLESKMMSIAATLELVLSGSYDEKELREGVQTVINIIKRDYEIKKPQKSNRHPHKR